MSVRIYVYGMSVHVYSACVTRSAGTLVHSEDGITVSYPHGQYTLRILDSVRVRVTSKVSHAHGFSLSLRLLRCGPTPRNSSGGVVQDSGGNKKLIEVGLFDQTQMYTAIIMYVHFYIFLHYKRPPIRWHLSGLHGTQ